MDRRRIALLLLIGASMAAFAQDTEPEDPGIVLPPVLLEVEDLLVEDVDAALPADEDQLRPEVSIPLPEAEALYLPDEVFDIPYPDQVGVTPGTTPSTYTEYLEAPRNPIFSDGRIGVGAPIHVLGDLSLYKLGEEPRFRLRFLHEKLDGYGFRRSGAGFFDSEDTLDGTLSFEGENTALEVSAKIGESSRGLQRELAPATAAYDAVTFRDVSGVATLSHTFIPQLRLAGALDAGYGTQILSAETPLLATEVAAAPEVRLEATLSDLSLWAETSYEFHSTSSGAGRSIDHRVSGIIGASYSLPVDVALNLDAGVYWSSAGKLLPDITVGADGRVGTLLQFSTVGGYEVRPIRYQRIWDDAPLIALSSSLVPEYGWTWSGTVQIRPLLSLLITADVGFDWMDGVVNPAADPDATTGLFGFAQERMIGLETSLAVEWDISSAFGIDLSWDGAFVDRVRYRPMQRIGLSFDAEDPGERFGGLLTTDLEFTPGVTIPIVGLGGYYRLSESVQFQLDVHDALAPLLSPGRYDWEPYIRPGLNAMLTTKISL